MHNRREFLGAITALTGLAAARGIATAATPAHQEYHVSPRGDDKNTGSFTRPLKTISAAAALAQAGDVITVHEGIYRERVAPPRGGTSDAKRIVYRAAPGERAVISGAEIVTGWSRMKDDVWRVVIPNTIFGAFNPYSDLIHGDWFKDRNRKQHTGAVYLNGDWLVEAAQLEHLYQPAADSLWFGQVDETNTTLFAQFKGINPNEQQTEINVRQTVFYPEKTGVNYITVRGFILRQAATPWAPPTAEQIGVIGPHWSKGWIIEDNVVSHSSCAGVSLGKYGDQFDNQAHDSATGYVQTIQRAVAFGWSAENIGHHTVRRNTVSHCEQAGIVGSLGAIFSEVTANVIHDIHVHRIYSGAEIAGIKLHAAIDTEISRNVIYGCYRGLWLDWMAQGTRVSRNLFHDNDAEDIFVEVSHGPFLVDNNLFLSKGSMRNLSQGGAYVHNLFCGSTTIVSATLLRKGEAIDEQSARVGFREAAFTPEGFKLNGKVVKLRGLDRHQTFPFVGQAMPARVQRKDADILRYELHCNIVRTSHYPQSRHFLDRCDEVGLLVLEEIPGWQHIGDVAWQAVAVDNVRRMLQRDWNHPSIVLWGVRINESPDNDAFYTRTGTLARSLDTTRQIGGIRSFAASHLLEDVFTINDFGFPLREPNHPLYLNTEFVGHTFPTKPTDDDQRHREHTLRHARIHNQLASDARYAGGLGWCAFDYNTHSNFGAGDRICYHGVMDIFRVPKPAAGFYKSQCVPSDEIVLEPAFHWAHSDESTEFTVALVCSNCEKLALYLRPVGENEDSWHKIAELDPDRETFPHLKYAPFQLSLRQANFNRFSFPWGDLRIDGIIGGQVKISRTLSGSGVDGDFRLDADSTTLIADGADATRVVMRVTDEFGAVRSYANDPIVLSVEGPAKLIGDSIFSLTGGVGAFWVKADTTPGMVTVRAKHLRLGAKTVRLQLQAASAEMV